MLRTKLRHLTAPIIDNNPITLQILGICSALAVTTSLATSLTMGAALTAVLMASNVVISLIRNHLPSSIRLIVQITIIASLVIVTDQLLKAYAFEMSQRLSIFVGLIVTNCIVLARTEAFASKNRVLPSMLDGFMMGLGLTLVLTILGGIREIIGSGTLLTGINLAFGESAKQFVIHVIPDYHGFLLAILPPGAFIGLGLLIAAKNHWEQRNPANIETLSNSQTIAA